MYGICAGEWGGVYIIGGRDRSKDPLRVHRVAFRELGEDDLSGRREVVRRGRVLRRSFRVRDLGGRYFGAWSFRAQALRGGDFRGYDLRRRLSRGVARVWRASSVSLGM